MKKSLLTFLGLLMVLGSFGQSWQQIGNTLQRRIIGSDTSYRFSLGQPGFMYLYTKPQVNTAINGLLPIGLQGQSLVVKTENTNSYDARYPVKYGNFIYTDDQLTRALSAGSASQQQIFNSFKRFAHGGNVSNPTGLIVNSDTIPKIASQTNAYNYDSVANVVNSTTNNSSFTGFISPDKFSAYIHRATLSANGIGSPTDANHGYDNDKVGLVIAYVEDPNDMVRNNAYGLNPGDFNWPINTTDQFIPNQHVLTLIRGREQNNRAYYITYDYGKLDESLLVNGISSGIYLTTQFWAGNSVDVEVTRLGDSIIVKTSNFSDAPGGKGSLRFPLKLSLASNPLLEKFRGSASYGYGTQSQANTTFTNIYFSGSDNVIYDLRNGDTYIYGNSGYTIDTTKNLYTDFGVGYWWRNSTEHTYGYILPTGTFDVLIGETP